MSQTTTVNYTLKVAVKCIWAVVIMLSAERMDSGKEFQVYMVLRMRKHVHQVWS